MSDLWTCILVRQTRRELAFYFHSVPPHFSSKGHPTSFSLFRRLLPDALKYLALFRPFFLVHYSKKTPLPSPCGLSLPLSPQSRRPHFFTVFESSICSSPAIFEFCLFMFEPHTNLSHLCYPARISGPLRLLPTHDSGSRSSP